MYSVNTMYTLMEFMLQEQNKQTTLVIKMQE